MAEVEDGQHTRALENAFGIEFDADNIRSQGNFEKTPIEREDRFQLVVHKKKASMKKISEKVSAHYQINGWSFYH